MPRMACFGRTDRLAVRPDRGLSQRAAIPTRDSLIGLRTSPRSIPIGKINARELIRFSCYSKLFQS